MQTESQLEQYYYYIEVIGLRFWAVNVSFIYSWSSSLGISIFLWNSFENM